MYTIQDVPQDKQSILRDKLKLQDDQIVEYYTLRKDKGLDHDKALKKAQSTSVKEYLGNVIGGFTEAVKSGGEIIQRSQDEIAQATQEGGLIGGFKEALTEAPQAILGGGGSIATGLANAFGEAISPVVEPVITQAIESAPEGVKEFVAEQAKGLSEWYGGLDQGAKDSLAVGNNLVNMLGLVLGGSSAGRSLVSQVGKTAGRIGLEGTAKAFDLTVKQPFDTFGPGIKKGIADFAKKAKTRTSTTLTTLAPVGRVAQKGGRMLATGVRGGIVRPIGAVVGGVKKAASATAKAIKPIEFIQAKIDDKMPGLLPGLKALNPKSKEILKETLEIAQERGGNVLSDKLVTDPLGRNLMDRIKAVNEYTRQAGKLKDEAVKTLPQEAIDMTSIKTQMLERLNRLGVQLTNEGELDFSDSVLKGKNFNSSREQIAETFAELATAKTPVQIDRMRQSLFDVLGLSKAQPLFSDKAKSVLGGIRDDLKTVIDDLAKTTSNEYTKHAQDYARGRQALDQASKALQLEKEDIANLDSFVEKITRAGEIARRLQGNASGITKDKFDDLLKLSAEINPDFADIDISTQAKIAIIIEKLLGIEQQNSLMSMVQGGIDNSVVGMASRLLESVGGADKDEIIQTLLQAIDEAAETDLQ